MNVWKFGPVALCAFLAAACAVSQGAASAPQKAPTTTINKTPAATGTTEKTLEKKRVPSSSPEEAVKTPAMTEVKPAEEKPGTEEPVPVEPLAVKPLLPLTYGRNDSNPTWSPSGELIAIERSKGDKKEIVIARSDGSVMETIYYQLSGNGQGMQFFFPGLFEDISYNAGVSWSPQGDRFVFMSNGGEGNYDCYLRELDGKTTVRLTKHKEKDGQAQWSPSGDTVVFVSGRTGKGDIYLMNIATRATQRITQGGKAYLYPQWSPKGTMITMIHGSNENHDIYVIGNVKKPVETLRALTAWEYDDLRPTWSPDGKKIAFYSNYNRDDDPKEWSLIVVRADGSDPTHGEGLAAKVVASNVIPDVERGPAWMPDSTRIVYVKNDRQSYNPLYIANIEDRTNVPLKTETKMNHDVSCSVKGTIAFRAQVNQWDQIFVATLQD